MSTSIQPPFWDPNTLYFDEEAEMTMQIGMIGSDGIVLASDTKLTETVGRRKRFEQVREEYNGPKILTSPENQMIVSCAHDIASAVAVARAVISEWKPEEEDEQASRLGALVNPFRGDKSFECIVATCRPKLSLFRILYLFHAENDGRLFVHRVDDRICAGDHPNGAQFWHLRYYDRSRCISELKNLAAQLIADAAFLNSGTIGGLDIVTMSNAGVIAREPEETCRQMEATAQAKTAEISKLLFSTSLTPASSL